MIVLMSIKPEHAEKIFSGEKKYEFRRAIFKRPNIKTVVVYASSPVQKVIGEFEIDGIISTELESLWKQAARQAGIDKLFFDKYFKGRETGFAIVVGRLNKYPEPLELKSLVVKRPPQSFCYLGVK